MRELKFRAFDTENKTWTFVTLGDLICGACTENGDKPLSGAKQVWEQYTGLKDKCGKEIYDGDIVRYTFDYPMGEWVEEVSFGKISDGEGYYHGEFLAWRTIDSDGDGHQSLLDLEGACEVIGNIHENEDLLEEEE